MVCKVTKIYLAVCYILTLTSGLSAAADGISLKNILGISNGHNSNSEPADLILEKWQAEQGLNDVTSDESAANKKFDSVWPKRAGLPEFNASGWRRKRSIIEDGMHHEAFRDLLAQLQQKLETQRGINRRGKPNFNASGWRKKRSSHYNALARFARDLMGVSRLRSKRQEEPQFNPSGW